MVEEFTEWKKKVPLVYDEINSFNGGRGPWAPASFGKFEPLLIRPPYEIIGFLYAMGPPHAHEEASNFWPTWSQRKIVSMMMI